MERSEFDLLFREYYVVLCHYTERLVEDTAVAEELVHEVFIRLWKYEGKPIGHVVGWLYKAARNAALDYIKSHRRRKLREQYYMQLHAGPVEASEEAIIRGELLRELMAAIDSLPAPYREVLDLSYRECLPSKVIATVLDTTVTAIDKRRARALNLLRKRVSGPALVLLINIAV